MEKMILILVPIYVAYIVFLGILMFSKRFKAVKNGEVELNYFKDYQGPIAAKLRVYQNHFENQFQLPVLFFIACVTIYQTKTATLLSVFLCYFFVLTRLLHSYFHLGSNNLRLRGLSFFIGVLLVLGIWIMIGISSF